MRQQVGDLSVFCWKFEWDLFVKIPNLTVLMMKMYELPTKIDFYDASVLYIMRLLDVYLSMVCCKDFDS